MSNEARTKRGKTIINATNEELAARIRAGENISQNMAALYDRMRGFIHSVAWKYRGCGVELEDLAQEGFLALYDAAAGYDPNQGASFSTYGEKWIRARLARYIQANGSSLRLPCHVQEKQRKYSRFSNAFQLAHGREPTEREMALCLGLTLKQAREARENAHRALVASLDAPIAGPDGGENATAGELVPSAEALEADLLERIEREELAGVLWEYVDGLPDNQPEVVRRRYQGRQSYRQIGEAIGATADAARQAEGKALRELRRPDTLKRLRPFLPEAERIYSMSVQGTGAERFRQTWTSSTERAAIKLIEKAEGQRQRGGDAGGPEGRGA